eukprot:GHVQ01027282.1.p1 GENE.GHVQ01027282.1~~GHVQ01027282.1.p1  ORF type:complete len:335 (-),score=78.48 GHVQ01027282.1:3063-4067(-)
MHTLAHTHIYTLLLTHNRTHRYRSKHQNLYTQIDTHTDRSRRAQPTPTHTNTHTHTWFKRKYTTQTHAQVSSPNHSHQQHKTPLTTDMALPVVTRFHMPHLQADCSSSTPSVSGPPLHVYLYLCDVHPSLTHLNTTLVDWTPPTTQPNFKQHAAVTSTADTVNTHAPPQRDAHTHIGDGMNDVCVSISPNENKGNSSSNGCVAGSVCMGGAGEGVRGGGCGVVGEGRLVECAVSVMPSEELDRAKRYRQTDDRLCAIVSRVMQRAMLRDHCGLDWSEIHIERLKTGLSDELSSSVCALQYHGVCVCVCLCVYICVFVCVPVCVRNLYVDVCMCV